MRATFLCLVIVWLVSCCAVALATPSTLIWIPSTDIQTNGTWHLGVDNYFAATAGTRSATDVGFEYGFLRGRAEAGIDYLGGQDDPLFLNIKYLLTAEKPKVPAVAVGFYNGGTRGGVTDDNMLFALGSKTFGPARLTLGYCHGNRSTLGQGQDMLLAGVDGYLTHDKKWWGAVDYQGGNSAFGALNFGVSYSFTEKISLILGYDVYNNRTLNPDNTLTTQLDVNF
jgi:hypothetical protein